MISSHNTRAQPTSEGPAVKRRLRHVLSFGVSGLTATPHRDEVLQGAVAGAGWRGAYGADGGAAAQGLSIERTSALKRHSLDDLELVGKSRRRGTSAGSAKSLRIPPSSPALPSSPSLPSSSSFDALSSTPPSSSGPPRRPSLSRARASSRLSLHGHPSRHSSYGLPDDATTSPTLSSSFSRLRSRSVTRTSGHVDHSLHGSSLVPEEDAIAEGQEDLPSAPQTLSGNHFFLLGRERERALQEAGERLLESFITIRLEDERIAALQRAAAAEAGPSGSMPKLNEPKRSPEEQRKGKYREEVSQFSSHMARPSSSTSSSDDHSCSSSATRSTLRRSSSSTTPSSSPTLHAHDKGADPPLDPDSLDTPFYISCLHKPSTNPRFPELSPDGADYAPWACEAGVTREERVTVDLWTRRRVREGIAGEGGWHLLKGWHVDLNNLKKLDQQAFIPPNTLTVRFADDGDTYFVPPPLLSPVAHHKLERVLSAPDLHKGAKVVEWGGAEEAILRSMRETRMKMGITADDLQRLLQMQKDLQHARDGLESLRAVVDELVQEFDKSDRLRRLSDEMEAKTRSLEQHQAEMRSKNAATRLKIDRLRKDNEDRRLQLSAGKDVVRERKAHQRELEASIELENSLRKDARPYIQAAQGTLARRLESIFTIMPVANGRAQPIFTILSAALPLPTGPKEPAPPLSLPSSQLPPGVSVDEEIVAAALGFVALLLDRLSSYLGTKLPYPVTCAGSRSLVKDPISEIVGPTRLFPLYSKGIEQYRFEYAVFLLNKDIELLMVGRGLRIMDLRHTLPNVMNLLLTVSSEQSVPTSGRNLPRTFDQRTRSQEASIDSPTISSPLLGHHFEDETESESEASGGSDAGDRTPKASDPSRGLFWGLGSGGSQTSGKAVSEKAVKPHRSRRGTLIARAFVGQGSASKERGLEGVPQGSLATS